MSAELVNLLTEIRDQQKQQIENFERAVEGQNQYLDLQRKGRRMFQFLVYAPWATLALVVAYMVLSTELLGR